VDVLTAQWDDTTRLPDPELLDQASALGRVLVSQDEDLLAEAAQWQRAGGEFAGLIYAHQRSITTARFIDDLQLIALGVSPRVFCFDLIFSGEGKGRRRDGSGGAP